MIPFLLFERETAEIIIEDVGMMGGSVAWTGKPDPSNIYHAGILSIDLPADGVDRECHDGHAGWC
jgi:hypothetical protein